MAPLVELYRTDHQSMVSWICKTYGVGDHASGYQNPHRLRRETMARRLRLYRDQAHVDLAQVIDQIYETEEYKQTLRRYISVALEQNVTRRIIDEVASLYDRPVLRQFPGDEAKTTRLRAEEQRLHLHEIAQESHHLVTLLNEVLEWQYTGADGKPKLSIVTPDLFDAIPHPSDRLVPAGFLLDMAPTTILDGEARRRLPQYEIWDDTFVYRVNGYGSLVSQTGDLLTEPEAHDLGRIPGVLLHRREPTLEILDCTHGADIESAHMGVALLNVMIMRLSKSQGERQPVLSGNLAAMTKGQVMNGERPLMLPPEVVASMLEMKTDPDHYLAVKRDKLASLAQTYGMSYEQYTNAVADTSGKAYAIRRQKLTEIRLESRRRGVLHERQRVELVLGEPADGLRTDFQEQAVPADAQEKLALLATKVKLGLDSPVKYLMREDPDLSRKDALALIQENYQEYAVTILMVRALNMPLGADADNPGRSPEENGAAGGRQRALAAGGDVDDAGDATAP